jgi:undecaprenyl-diphosphatase
VAFDHDAAAWVVHHRLGELDWFFVALSRLGTGGLVWIAIALLLALFTRRPPVLLTVAAVLLADATALAVKVVVHRPRPHLDPLLRVPTDWSFPSGHASTSFAGATMLAHFLPRQRFLLYGLAVAIAFSRVYVGVHYPLDVLAGAALGTAVGWAGITSLPRLGRFPRRSPGGRRSG